MKKSTPAFSIDVSDRYSLIAAFDKRGHSLNKKDADEVNCLKKYFFTLENAGLLQYPIDLSKSESPDFCGHANGITYGIEVTKATLPADKREIALTRAGLHPVPRGSLGGRYPRGSFGNKEERDLVADCFRAVRRKTAKIRGQRGESFRAPQQLDLLLHADGNHWMSKIDILLPMLADRFERWKEALTRATNIRRISLIKGSPVGDTALIVLSLNEKPQVLKLKSELSH